MKNIYLFFGDEKYLITEQVKKMKEDLILPDMETMNYDLFEESRIDTEKIIDAASTLPFLNDTRLVVVRHSGFFSTGKKDETEKIYDFIQDDLGQTILIFIEDEVDKRNKLYKKVAQIGVTKEFKALSEKEMILWVCKLFKKEGNVISNQNAAHFTMTLAADMDASLSEVKKLSAYKGTGNEITKDDIDLVCTKALETKIFDLVDAIGLKKPETALEIYSNLMNIKQSPIMVLAMIARQFRLVLQAKYMGRKNYQHEEMIQILKVRPFVVKACIKQAANFSVDILMKAFEECLETDVNIKTGKIDEKIGVEILIIKYSSMK